MGNCQTMEAAATVIQHPVGPHYKVERIYRPIHAHEVMSLNPGHYVALLVFSATAQSTSTSVRLKLLHPADALCVGNVYRLIPFEDVVKKFASSKKSIKFGNVLSMQEDLGGLVDPLISDPNPEPSPNLSGHGHQNQGLVGNVSRSGMAKLGQWKPALQSIAEIGS